MRRLIAAICIALCGTFASVAPSAAVRDAASPLPGGELHFGVASEPTELSWMTSSHVPWRYRYTYLAGGVNTGSGWSTWNLPSGQYATNYMNASSAAGYIPVFPYYMLLQSRPSSGSNESDRDFGNLNNATTMAAYYADFKLLMQKAGAFGKTVIVHVEPDLWGYLEQRAAGGTASSLSASVASSGFAEAAGLPNTAAGFAYELLKLRDSYAPNALLAIHASLWGSGIDIGSDTDPSVSATHEADVTAAFLNSAGIVSNPYGSTWDLVFDDVDDHDAGWWEKQGAFNQYYTHWWDPTNTRFPNFTRYLSWAGEMHAKTARPQVVWQVPVGNQYFLTMNNTCGHYQDTFAQYFVSHADDLYAAGLVAVLFGAGNSCQTVNVDGDHDGITNNGGRPTTDVLGRCSACNTHVSGVSDDDGGYLRYFVGAYYLSKSWASVGGSVVSAPEAAAGSGTSEDVFARGPGNALLQDHWNGGAWAGWASIAGNVTGDVGAVSNGMSRTDVFTGGTDNQLYHQTWNGSSWSPPVALGGVLTYGPDASLRPGTPAHVDVWVAGTGGQLFHKWSDDGGNTYGAWQALGGVLTSDPRAVSWSAGRVDIFARGTDFQLYHRWWDAASGWSQWQALGGYLTSAPDVASCASGRLDVFARGTDNGLWRLSWNGAAWSGWLPLGGSWSNAPSAQCRPGTSQVDLFDVDSGGAVWMGTIGGS